MKINYNYAPRKLIMPFFTFSILIGCYSHAGLLSSITNMFNSLKPQTSASQNQTAQMKEQVIFSSAVLTDTKEKHSKLIEGLNLILAPLNESDPIATHIRKRTLFKIQVVADSEISEPSALRSDASSAGTELTLKIRESSLNSPKLFIPDLLLATSIAKKGALVSNHLFDIPAYPNSKLSLPLQTAEILYNAQSGSLSAKTEITALKTNILSSAFFKSSGVELFQTSSTEVQQMIEKMKSEVILQTESANKYEAKRQNLFSKWKSESKTLDQLEEQNEKLNDLILKNDRSGVKKLLETYLPWTVMEPLEAQAWRHWLEAIEHPNYDKPVFGFRGLDYTTDKLQRMKTPQGERIGMFSTVLTKNQGNYNRRLRSLSTNREKNGNKFKIQDQATYNSVTLVSQMHQHSLNPVASSFLSFSYDPGIAWSFSKAGTAEKPEGGIVAVRLDSRRIFANVISGYERELELLAPLVIFPDEVVAFKEGPISEIEFRDFVAKVSTQSNIPFDQISYGNDASKLFKTGFIEDGYQFMNHLLSGSVGIKCEGIRFN